MQLESAIKLKYIENRITDGVVNMNLRGVIGQDIDSKEFVNEINFIANHTDIKTINVRINSPGGNVFAGMDIWSAIYNNPDVEINTIVVGVAASIAGVISQAGRKREAFSFSRLMIHDVSFNGLTAESTNITEDEKTRLLHFRDMIAEVLASRSNLSKEEVLALMVNKETWLKAGDAFNKGFFSNVIPVAEEGKADTSNALDMYNYFENKLNLENRKMKDLFNVLNISEDATEEVAVEAVNSLSGKIEELTTELNASKEENEALKEENTTLKGDAEQAKAEKIENYVSEKIEKGVFDEKDKATLIEEASNNFDLFKKTVESIKLSGHVNVLENLEPETEEGGTELNPENKTFSELDKNDPDTLEKIRKENFEEYSNLYEAQFGTKPRQ